MKYENVTFVMSLPRSRTAWMAETFGAFIATRHEPLRTCGSIRELQGDTDAALSMLKGKPLLMIDTAAAMFHQEIDERFPGSRRIFVRRNQRDVVRSVERLGLRADHIDKAGQYFRAAREAEFSDDRMTVLVEYEELNQPSVLSRMLRFAGSDQCVDPVFWEQMIATRIQVPLERLFASVNPRKLEDLFQSIRPL